MDYRVKTILKENQKKLYKIVFITFLSSLIWAMSCSSQNPNDAICVCYIYVNGLQARVDEVELGSTGIVNNLRKDCEGKSYIIDDDNYSSCQYVSVGFDMD